MSGNLKRIIIWASAALAAAAVAVTAVILIKGAAARQREREAAMALYEASVSEWEEFIADGSYCAVIQDTLENASERYNLPRTVWEWATYDLDGDGDAELLIRLGVTSENRAHTFIIDKNEEGAFVAGVFKGFSYPIYSPENGYFEVPSEDGEKYPVAKLEDGRCDVLFTLTDLGGEYLRDGEPIDPAEYGSYFDDGVFFDWTQFITSFAYVDRSSFDYAYKYMAMKPYGEVPDDMKRVVEENLFANSLYVNGRVVCNAAIYSGKVGSRVEILDKYGAGVGSFEVEWPLGDVLPASDGGLVYCARKVELVPVEEGSIEVMSVYGKVNVVKLSRSGDEEWRYVIESDVAGACRLAECDAGYIVACAAAGKSDQNPFSGYRETDVLMISLTKGGELIDERTVGGSHVINVFSPGDVYPKTFSSSGDGLEERALFGTFDRVTFMIYSSSGDNGIGGEGTYYITPRGDLKDFTVTKKDDGDDVELSDVNSLYYSNSMYIDYGGYVLEVGDIMIGGRVTDGAGESYKYVDQTVYSAFDRESGELLWRGVAERDYTPFDGIKDYEIFASSSLAPAVGIK